MWHDNNIEFFLSDNPFLLPCSHPLSLSISLSISLYLFLSICLFSDIKNIFTNTPTTKKKSTKKKNIRIEWNGENMGIQRDFLPLLISIPRRIYLAIIRSNTPFDIYFFFIIGKSCSIAFSDIHWVLLSVFFLFFGRWLACSPFLFFFFCIFCCCCSQTSMIHFYTRE